MATGACWKWEMELGVADGIMQLAAGNGVEEDMAALAAEQGTGKREKQGSCEQGSEAPQHEKIWIQKENIIFENRIVETNEAIRFHNV